MSEKLHDNVIMYHVQGKMILAHLCVSIMHSLPPARPRLYFFIPLGRGSCSFTVSARDVVKGRLHRLPVGDIVSSTLVASRRVTGQ